MKISRNKLLKYIIILKIVLALLLFSDIISISAAESGEAVLTYLEGGVFVGNTQTGPWKKLEIGNLIKEGNFLKTGREGLAELHFPDNSVVRLSRDTILKIHQTYFPRKDPIKVSINLFLGRAWMNISKKILKPRGSFDMHIPTATIGVRGTVYDVNSLEDKSADISVFEGLVGVGPPLFKEGGPREEIQWPTEVTEKEWEEIIVKKLERLHIGADGIPGKAKSFDPEKEKDEWVLWNMEKDAGKK